MSMVVMGTGGGRTPGGLEPRVGSHNSSTELVGRAHSRSITRALKVDLCLRLCRPPFVSSLFLQAQSGRICSSPSPSRLIFLLSGRWKATEFIPRGRRTTLLTHKAPAKSPSR